MELLLTEKSSAGGRIKFRREDQRFSLGPVEFEMLSDFPVEMSERQ